jgi:phage terminase large subunit-like protein
MSSRGEGNAAKRVATTEEPPWRAWRIKKRYARAIKFIELYCIPPKGYGAGKPLVLADFQKNWLEEVLAPDVTSAALSLPRGNGKSTLLAAFGVWAGFDEDETGAPQVPMVGTTINQVVRSTYGVALSMIAHHPELQSRGLVFSGMGTQRVKTPHNEGEIFPISNDPDGLQGLDPSVGVVDEVGFMPIQSWDSLLLASGKRPHSLVAGIGTPGFDRTDSALWHLRERETSGDELPGFSFTEYAADEGCDVHDEAQWDQANPALAEGFMNLEALRTAVAITPDAHFRIFRLGQWIEGVQCWLGDDGLKLWASLADPWEMEAGGDTWAGIDVGLKHDSTAVSWVQRRDDARFHVQSRIWLPTETGRLDVSDVMQHLRTLATRFNLRSVAFDPRFFDLPAQQLLDEGFPMTEVPQSLERMTPAAGNALEMIVRREVSHDDDPAFAAQVLNAIPRYNERGFVLAKAKSRNRIDAAIAMLLALAEAVHYRDQGESAPSAFFA